MTLSNSSGRGSANVLEWSEIQVAANLSHSDAGECIAHLVAGNLIDSGIGRPTLRELFKGGSQKRYFWATETGLRFLASKDEGDLPEVVELPQSSELRPEDIDDAVRIFENSMSRKPYVKPGEVTWAEGVLDDDVKGEIRLAAHDLQEMWDEFERLFGHRSAVRNAREAAVRDPVVKQAMVRTLRAADEQRRRRGFGPSAKPATWDTHYQGGNVGLRPALWE